MPLSRQGGTSLIEALIAIVIFSFATLGIIGLQARMMQYNHNAEVRAQASFYAEQLLGLAIADPAHASCYAVGNQSGCNSVASRMVSSWREQVVRKLPGADTYEPAATFNTGTGRFRLVLQWKRDQELTVNNLVVETLVRP